MTDEAPPEPESEHDRIGALMSDVVDGSATAEVAAEVDAHVATCATCREELTELRAARAALKGLAPAAAPADLGTTVEATINRRSAGRFFGRKTLGDRVPFGIILVVALVALMVIVGLLWSSTTGSLRPEPKTHPRPPPGARDAIPRPIAP
jgi:anti-sigma factor RsiW